MKLNDEFGTATQLMVFPFLCFKFHANSGSSGEQCWDRKRLPV